MMGFSSWQLTLTSRGVPFLQLSPLHLSFLVLHSLLSPPLSLLVLVYLLFLYYLMFWFFVIAEYCLCRFSNTLPFHYLLPNIHRKITSFLITHRQNQLIPPIHSIASLTTSPVFPAALPTIRFICGYRGHSSVLMCAHLTWNRWVLPDLNEFSAFSLIFDDLYSFYSEWCLGDLNRFTPFSKRYTPYDRLYDIVKISASGNFE